MIGGDGVVSNPTAPAAMRRVDHKDCGLPPPCTLARELRQFEKIPHEAASGTSEKAEGSPPQAALLAARGFGLLST